MQYIGGIDPRNTPGDTRGFVNTDACYNVQGQYYVPFVDGYPINNLHIHSKDLNRWKSSRDQEWIDKSG